MPLRYIQMSQHGITAIYRCHNQTYKFHNVQYLGFFLTKARLSKPAGHNFLFTFCSRQRWTLIQISWNIHNFRFTLYSSVDKDGP